MRDSLTNRFRGAFLGSWLSENAALAGRTAQALWSAQMLAATDRLLGRPLEVETAPAGSHLCSGQLLPDLLPIALLHHEQPQQLQQRLREISAVSGAVSGADANPDTAVALAVIGQTISLILRERFVAAELILQVIRDLDLPDLPLVQTLLQVQTWLAEPADLVKIASALQARDAANSVALADPVNRAVAMALYSFLSSPDDFQISWQRLRVLQSALPSQPSLAPDLLPNPALAAALLGAISGLYGGVIGIPVSWQSGGELGRKLDWELSLFQRADLLLTCWAGASSQQWLKQPHASLVAAPRVIRPG